jgi:parvulin-like peptidyl-prolyl isomerase
MNIKTFWILTAGLLLAGCADKPQFTPEEMAMIPLAKRDGLPDASGGFVLAVGEQTVTAEDVVGPIFEDLAKLAQRNDFDRFRQIAEPAIEQQLTGRISDAILYSRAKKDAGDKIEDELDRVVNAELRKFVLDFGGDYAKAEQALKQMGMDWGQFDQYKRRYVLSQSYIAQLLPGEKPVMYGEMKETYDQTKEKFYTVKGSLQFRLIDIEPAKLQNIDANRPQLGQARELAVSLVNRANQGEDFEKLAGDFSQTYKVSAGGLKRKVDPESLAPPYDILAARAAAMKPGEVTEPLEAQGHILIMQLVDYQPKGVEPFEKVQNEVKARITTARMRDAMYKLNEELLQQASAADKKKFVKFCVQEIYAMANK